MTKRASTSLLFSLLLILSACAGTMTPAHPGQLNAFDGAAYDSLIIAQASLSQASQQVTAAPTLAKYKAQLNQAIAAYNTAQAAYKLYHSAPTADQATALQAQLADVVSQVSKLLTALGVSLK